MTEPRNSRDEFSRRLYRLMLEKSMTQSDLARAADMERNRISSYVRGHNLPTPLSLKKLAEALGVQPSALLTDESATGVKSPCSTSMSSDGSRMRLTCDVWVSTAVGLQIVQLITEGAPSDIA